MSLKEDFYNFVKNNEDYNWLNYFKEYTNEELIVNEDLIYDDYWYWQFHYYYKEPNNIYIKFKEKYLLEDKLPQKYLKFKRKKI